MSPQRRSSAPTVDVARLRADLDAGKLVRVSIAPSGQFPDGETGRIRSIGDPAVDGDEFLSVEVGAGAAKDVLPFAPVDLLPWSRKGSGAASAGPAPIDRRPIPNVRTATPPPGTAPGSGDTSGPVPGVTDRPRLTLAAPPGPAAAVATPKSTRGRRPAVTITVSTDGESGWRVEARVGSRIAVRSTALAPARVSEIAHQLGEPKLMEAVDDLLADHRRAVQTRADALAAELAAVRAELDSYPPR